MIKYLVVILFLIAGCSTTSTITIENAKSRPIKNGVDFNISVKEGPSSSFTKHFSDGFCGLDLAASVTKVNDEGEWDPYSKIEFSNSDDSIKFSVLFYFNQKTKVIMTLIKHSEDDAAEPFGVNFSVGDIITVMIYSDLDKMGISLEPASKMKNILSFNGAEKYSEDFEFSVVEIGFKPEKVTFVGVSVDSLFEDIRFRAGC